MFCSLFFSYETQVQRKGALTMALPLTLWPEWLLHNLLPPLLCCQIPLLDALLNYGTSSMLKNGTLSPPSGLLFT